LSVGYAQKFTKLLKQAVRVATQYASAPCKLTVSSHLFARWRCCSSYLFARWCLFLHVGYLTSATSWSLTFWPWKWCRSHVWRGLPLCQF